MENQNLDTSSELNLPEIPGIETFDQAEWVFQFDDDEPVVIAWSNSEDEPGELAFTLKANSESSVIFKSPAGEKTLRLYSRKMSDSRRQELKTQKMKEQEILEKLQEKKTI